MHRNIHCKVPVSACVCVSLGGGCQITIGVIHEVRNTALITIWRVTNTQINYIYFSEKRHKY